MSGKKKYDIVFLDHMMPDKDGIETLHEMREMPDDPNGDTVAVCLTANAISGAKEKYLSAGFDDYLTKPIDADKLEEMLIRYLPEEKVVLSESDREPHGEEKPLPEWLLHCVGIDPGQGVVNCGGTEEYLSVLEGFHSTVSDRADEIEAYYDNGDLKNYTIKVHALKSSARIIGAMELSEKARLLEEAGNENNIDFIKEKTAELLGLYRSYENILSSVAEKSDGRPDIPGEMLADAYGGLSEFTEMQDYELARMVVDSLKEYRLPEPDVERFKRIDSKLAQMDWDGIREILKEAE
jgi:DNA-binding response OmpR family regulator